MEGRQLVIQPSEFDRPHLKKLYGYIVNLRAGSSDDAASPFTATVVVKLPFRYGPKDSENQPSCVFSMINAFAAKAVLAKTD